MKTTMELAKEAGFWQEHTNTWMCSTQDIEAFTKLVRDDDLYVLVSDAVQMAENAYKNGQADEREACADLCYQLVDNSRETRFATTIRARSNT